MTDPFVLEWLVVNFIVIVLAIISVCYLKGLNSWHNVKLLFSILGWGYCYDFMVKREERRKQK